MEILKIIFYILIFPGLLISALMGMLLSGCDSYITAIIGKGKKPKILQSFIGFVKFYDLKTVKNIRYLKIKQFIIPFLKLATLIFVILFIPIFNFSALSSSYDLIIVIYFLGLPQLFSVLKHALRTNNKLGESNKKRILNFIAYEIPFVIIILTLVIFIGLNNGNKEFIYSLKNIAEYQIHNGSLLFRYELLPAALGFILLMHMKVENREIEFYEEKNIKEEEINTTDFLYYKIKNLNYNLNSYIIVALFISLFLSGITLKITIIDFLIFFLLIVLIGIVTITIIRGLVNKYFTNKQLVYFKVIPSILTLISLFLVLLEI